MSYKYICYRCGIKFAVDNQLDTDRPVCDGCFDVIKGSSTYQEYTKNTKPIPKSKWDGNCECGHKHSEHGESMSINYSAGCCQIDDCNCAHFLTPKVILTKERKDLND